MNIKQSSAGRIAGVLLLGGLGWLSAGAQVRPPFDASGFSYSANLRLDGYTAAGVLTNFPVLVQFNTNLDGFSYSQVRSPGAADLRFVSGGTNELNYEVDAWNPAGDSYAWVQVPAVSSGGTLITAYWGQAGLAKPAYATNGATWSNGYLGVWHLNQPNAVNSVSGVTGTAHGNTTSTGVIGSAQYFNTNTFNTYLDLGNLRATNLTIEAWTLRANTSEYTNYNVDDVVFRKSGSFQWYQWNVDWNLQLDIYGSATFSFQHNGIFDLPLPAWSYAVVSYDSGTGTGRGYLNGVTRYTDVTAYFNPAATASTSALTLEVGSTAPVGTFSVTLGGTGGGLTRTTTLALTVTPSTPGAAYTWPTYSPNLDYDFRTDYPTLGAPTNVLNDCVGVVGTVASNWWCFRYGPSKNPLVTAAAWEPLLARMNSDFAYFRDVMGWPPDKRAKNGYYSAIYLYGSGLCTDNAANTNLGGWMGSLGYNGQDWPMVLLSYYPVYSFDPACTYGDRLGQQGACVHEGIHAILADMPGCRQAGWFHEGGNTWLQSTAAALQSGNYNSMGWLSAGAMIAPFMPVECYSGWLQDDSFGGPSAEGVNRYDTNGAQLCTWRNLLGGTQYGEAFPHFMGEIVAQGSVAWIWQFCTKRVLEGLATAPGGLGEFQTRRLIKEYRARQAMCDFGHWTPAYKSLLNNNWGATIRAEYPPYWIVCSNWTASCYALTTNVGGTLIPERRTLPAWSGANQVPLTVSGSGTVSVNFLPLGPNLSCQLVYRAPDNSVVYSVPVASGACSLTLGQPVKNNVVIAVICNTDYRYQGEASRTNKHDYRLTLGAGVTGTASVNTKWFN